VPDIYFDAVKLVDFVSLREEQNRYKTPNVSGSFFFSLSSSTPRLHAGGGGEYTYNPLILNRGHKCKWQLQASLFWWAWTLIRVEKILLCWESNHDPSVVSKNLTDLYQT